MNILFIHQNFPGQFVHLAADLAKDKRNTVMALSIHKLPPPAGVTVRCYTMLRPAAPETHPLLQDQEAKVLRAEACAAAALQLQREGFLPDVIVACVGGGSNAAGIFSGFAELPDVELWGAEPAGGAAVGRGVPGIVHGMKSFLMQDEWGQVLEAESISAGLDYPGVGPEHSWLKTSERAEYVAVDDTQALEGFKALTSSEGIIPALEPSHAIYHAMQVARTMRPDQDLLIGLSGRGDKDMHTVAAALGVTL